MGHPVFSIRETDADDVADSSITTVGHRPTTADGAPATAPFNNHTGQRVTTERRGPPMTVRVIRSRRQRPQIVRVGGGLTPTRHEPTTDKVDAHEATARPQHITNRKAQPMNESTNTGQPMSGNVGALRLVLGVRAAEDGDTAQLMAVVDDLDSAAMVNALMALARLLSVYFELQHGEGTDALLRANLAGALAHGG